MPVDCIYIAASARDSRFTRICVASVRYFYPDVPIRLLAGGKLQRGLAEELRRYWNVGIADFPRGEYGWGFVKLEPLFQKPGEKFLVLDSDTVITGPVLDWAVSQDADFIVDDEDQPPEKVRSIYYDCDRAVQDGVPLSDADFVFNTGQWFSRSGILTREDFRGLVQWGFPPRLTNPHVFKNGEQGILNFVVNERAREGNIRVARIPLMRWPGHGMDGLDTKRIARRDGPPVVVHWAGMKKARQREMMGSDLLLFFEKFYYQRLPAGGIRRVVASCRHALSHWLYEIKVRAKLRMRKISQVVAPALANNNLVRR